MAGPSKPSHHVRPGEHYGNRDLRCAGIHRIPVVNRHRETGLFVIIRQDGRELLDREFHRHLGRLVVKPGLRIQRGVFAMSNRKIPFPGSKRLIGRSICGQHLGIRGGITLTLSEHAELVSGNTLILVHAGLHMPTFKFAPIGAGKRAGSKTADRRSLPITVINHVLNFRLLPPGVFQRQPDRAMPRRFRYLVTGKAKLDQRKNNDEKPNLGWFHRRSPGGIYNLLKPFSSANPSSPPATRQGHILGDAAFRQRSRERRRGQLAHEATGLSWVFCGSRRGRRFLVSD